MAILISVVLHLVLYFALGLLKWQAQITTGGPEVVVFQARKEQLIIDQETLDNFHPKPIQAPEPITPEKLDGAMPLVDDTLDVVHDSRVGQLVGVVAIGVGLGPALSDFASASIGWLLCTIPVVIVVGVLRDWLWFLAVAVAVDAALVGQSVGVGVCVRVVTVAGDGCKS